MMILTNLKIIMTGKIGKITEDESNQQFKMGHYVTYGAKILVTRNDGWKSKQNAQIYPCDFQ